MTVIEILRKRYPNGIVFKEPRNYKQVWRPIIIIRFVGHRIGSLSQSLITLINTRVILYFSLRSYSEKDIIIDFLKDLVTLKYWEC